MKKTKNGKKYKPGDVILVTVQYTDTFEIKRRPAVVLFSEFGNVVVAGITSNLSMKGIPLSKKDGAIKDSVIKLNYIFTVSEKMIQKILFHLNTKKKSVIRNALSRRLSLLS